MQRTEEDGVIISCDFCGIDWDQQLAMIEGHRAQFPAPGVICLECIKIACDKIAALPGDVYACIMCRLQEIEATKPRWQGQRDCDPPSFICRDCLNQGAIALDKDPDVDWSRDKTKRL
jgi:hypothetical protein